MRRLFEPKSLDEHVAGAEDRRSTACSACGRWSSSFRSTGCWSPRSRPRSKSTAGPFYLPFVDFEPSLHAWNFMLLQNNTLGPYFNSIVVALLEHGARACSSARLRPTRWCASASRSSSPPSSTFIVLLVAVIVAVAALRMSTGRSRGVVAIALFLLALGTFGRRFKAGARQQRHRVLDDLEPHHAADRRRAADLCHVPASPAARHAIRADRDLYRRQPADRRLADARLLRRHARSTSRRARRSTARRSSASSSPSPCRWCARAWRRPSCWS